MSKTYGATHNGYGCWRGLVTENFFDTPKTLKELKLSNKSIDIMIFVKHKMHLDKTTYYDIATCTVFREEQYEFVENVYFALDNDAMEIKP